MFHPSHSKTGISAVVLCFMPHRVHSDVWRQVCWAVHSLPSPPLQEWQRGTGASRIGCTIPDMCREPNSLRRLWGTLVQTTTERRQVDWPRVDRRPHVQGSPGGQLRGGPILRRQSIQRADTALHVPRRSRAGHAGPTTSDGAHPDT